VNSPKRRDLRVGRVSPVRTDRSRPWFETRAGRERLESDLALLDKHLAGRFKVLSAGTTLAVEVEIRIVLRRSDAIRTASLLLIFPDDYPRSAPTPVDVANAFRAHAGKSRADRHVSDDGVCCLWLESPWKRGDSNALLGLLLQLELFVHRQLIYEVIGRWAGPQWRHGDDGLEQFVLESLSDSPRLVELFAGELRGGTRISSRRADCPCGSGRRYDRCHRPTIESIRGVLNQGFVDAVRSGRSLRVDDAETRAKKRGG